MLPRLRNYRTGIRFPALICCGLVLLFLPNFAAGQTQTHGSSKKKLRQESVASIPFKELNRQTQKRIKDVVRNPSFYRRLPTETIDSDPDFFRFLIRKPEFVVSIWELMGVTQMTTERTGPYTVKTNDGAGTTSELELVYGNDNLHIFYGTGAYAGPILRRKLTGRCVIVLRTQTKAKSPSGFALSSKLDVFLKVDNATANLVTKTISPIVGSTADHNFIESLKFVEKLNMTTRNNGPGVKAMGRRLKIDDKTRQQFEVVVDRVYERAYNMESAIPTSTPAPRRHNASPRRTRTTQQNASSSGNLDLYRPSSKQYSFVSGAPKLSSPGRRQRQTGVQSFPNRFSATVGSRKRQTAAASLSLHAPSPAVAERKEPAGFSILEGGPRTSADPAGRRVADLPSQPVSQNRGSISVLGKRSGTTTNFSDQPTSRY